MSKATSLPGPPEQDPISPSQDGFHFSPSWALFQWSRCLPFLTCFTLIFASKYLLMSSPHWKYLPLFLLSNKAPCLVNFSYYYFLIINCGFFFLSKMIIILLKSKQVYDTYILSYLILVNSRCSVSTSVVTQGYIYLAWNPEEIRHLIVAFSWMGKFGKSVSQHVITRQYFLFAMCVHIQCCIVSTRSLSGG